MSFDKIWNEWFSYEDCKQEIARHNCRMEDFVTDHGCQPEYEGKTVLIWLGY